MSLYIHKYILGYIKKSVCWLLVSPPERKSNVTFWGKRDHYCCCVSWCVWRGRGASVFHSHRFIANNTYMFTSMQACKHVCVPVFLWVKGKKRRSKRGKWEQSTPEVKGAYMHFTTILLLNCLMQSCNVWWVVVVDIAILYGAMGTVKPAVTLLDISGNCRSSVKW